MFIFAVAHPVYFHEIQIKFVYEGYRVKVKITAAKKVENPYFLNVKLRVAITQVRVQFPVPDTFRYVTNQPPKANSAFHPSRVGK